MNRKIVILFAMLLSVLGVSAREQADTLLLNLTRQFYQLLDTDQKEKFYEVSEQLQQMFLEKGDWINYYTIRQNEIVYDTNHGDAYKAIKKANDMLEDMKSNGTDLYDFVYLSLGNLFESRGSYRMAVHYYQEALDHVIDTNDSLRLAHVYSQLVAVNLTHDTGKAWYWNERFATVLKPGTISDKIYLVLKAQIHFFNGQKEAFFETKDKLDQMAGQAAVAGYTYGDQVVKIMDCAFHGKYDEALSLLEQDSQDYDVVKRCDIRAQIYQMMGLDDMALNEVNRRRDIRDSLNNDLLFSNINEINAAAGINKLNEETSEEREMWLSAVIILLVIAIGLIISRYFVRQRYQKRILRQNEQLEIALDEAKESERMKNIFIQHISHEIRTPLNVITGYAQIITNPAFELETEERNRMLQAIGQNTVAITDIVNDLLEISQEESKERYRRDDRIAVNAFCRSVMKATEEHNMGRLQLSFQTTLSDDFSVLSNQSGIERILQQLLSNALKFTEQGQVELSVSRDTEENTMSFAVTDTGIGIPKEHQEQVFEHFYKLDSFKQGLGVGLSMSRKIAILLGGTLAIDKDYENGTRMVLTIPAK